MIVVADSSALIALATCSALDVLVTLCQDLYVPQAIYAEVSHQNKPYATILGQFLQNRIVAVDRKQVILTVGGLGNGEVEAMALYWQVGADRLLIDDRRAKRIAEANHINCVGTLGLLLLAKHHGVITEITPFVNKLQNSPLHYTEALLSKMLQLAGEL